MNYKAEMNDRFWVYQRAAFPHWQGILERPQAGDGRPPVFLKSEAWRNVITDPSASNEQVDRLLNLVSESERHRWFRSMSSSQALAQSVWGNLAVTNMLTALKDLHDDDGESLFGDARLSPDSFRLEFKVDSLNEPRRTSLDGFFSGDYQVAVECKFAETGVGNCSRPSLTRNDSQFESGHCDGTYSVQRGRKTRCTLTELGVLYWRYIPSVFHWKDNADLNPCPVKANYQLVRNVLAATIDAGGRQTASRGHAVLIYDDRNPAFQKGGDGFVSFSQTRDSLIQQQLLRKCSWQRIVAHLRQKVVLPWLTDQLALKYGL